MLNKTSTATKLNICFFMILLQEYRWKCVVAQMGTARSSGCRKSPPFHLRALTHRYGLISRPMDAVRRRGGQKNPHSQDTGKSNTIVRKWGRWWCRSPLSRVIQNLVQNQSCSPHHARVEFECRD